MNIKKTVIGAAAGVLLLAGIVTTAFAANTTVVVLPGNLDNTSSNPAVVATDGLNKWFMYNDTSDTIDNTLGSFVTGPATPPHGIGSIQFTVGASPLDRKNIATYRFSGTPLASITDMSFGVYSHSGVAGPNEDPFLNFNVDFTGTGAWQHRLVYVPSANGTVTQDTWQTWDAINGGNANWNYSGTVWPTASAGPDHGVSGTPGSTLKTWSTILADYPNIRLLPVGGWLGIRVGEPGPTNYTANVDFFSLGMDGNTTTYNFDPAVGPPVNENQCKNNGWMTFNNPTFTNQGQCIKYVEEHEGTIVGNPEYTAYGLHREIQFTAQEEDLGTHAAHGWLQYTDANHDRYVVQISHLHVVGNNAYFAGKVITASNHTWVGNWLLAQVQKDTPDKVWGSFTTMTAAINGVNTATSPADGPFNVTGGHIIIKP